MKEFKRVLGRTLAAVYLVIGFGVLGAACGEGGDEPTCDEVTCVVGVCEAGACVNPDTCEASAECLPGYSCTSGVCRAERACEEDADCPVGACRAGVCVNPSTCASDDECLENSYCAESGTCEADPCLQVDCESGGVCQRGTTECVSAEVCAQDMDCVDGEVCFEESCLTEEAFCEALDCPRGVCSVVERACVSAEDCAGDDAQCVEGEVCSEDDACIEDLCVANGVTCEEGGVCLPRVGECQNAEVCGSSADCVAGHLCVEGVCRLESVACGPGAGDGGCFGNQTCRYDEGSLEASCEEPAGCETSLDCSGERQCGGQTCLEPVDCQADRFEPNDTADAAVTFAEAATGQGLRAELCAGDVDFFTFDTQEFEPFAVRGTLVVELAYASRDRGLGEVEIELAKEQADGSFQVVTSASSGPRGERGAAVIEEALSAADQGVYRVEVTGADDLSRAGVSYTLSARLLDEQAVNACEGAQVLTSGQVFSADMGNAVSTQYGASCTDPSNENTEQVYTFEVPTPARVSVTVTPADPEEDAAFSVRSGCSGAHAEVVCVNDGVEGVESLNGRLLDPGRYFVLVEAAPGSSLGAYDVSMTLQAAACSDASSVCEDATVSNYCVDGAGLQTVSCQRGCNPTTGRCFRVEGDICETAPVITPGDIETVTWGQLFEDYRVEPGGCVPGGISTQSAGPDKVFRVDVPQGKALSATLTMATGEPGSLYLLDSCQSPGDACRAGANGGGDTEALIWVNDTGADQRLFLVADSEAGQTLTAADLSVEIVDVVCAAGELSCDANQNVQRCDGFGLGYIPEETCGFGCTAGVCDDPPGDTCGTAQALAVSAGATVTVSGDFSDFTNQLTLPIGQCRVDVPHQSTDELNGPEVFYEVVLGAGELMRATLDTVESDIGMYVLKGCGGASAADSCQVATQGTSQMEFFAPSAGTYTLVVDTQGASGATFSLDVEVVAAGTYVCQPAGRNCSGSAPDELVVCNRDGTVIENTYTCENGCSTGFCNPATPLNDDCASATLVTGGAVVFDSPTRFSDRLDIGSAGCGSTDDGLEAVFRVDLQPDEVLTVEYQGAGPSSTVNHDPTVYLLKNSCSNPSQSCVGAADGNVETDDPAFIRYSASAAETIYIVAETDTTSTSYTDERWYMSIDIQPTECNAGDARCNASGTALEICEDFGLYGEYPCNGGCASGACVNPAGDICVDAVRVTPGVTVSGSFSGQSNQLDAGTDACLQGAIQDGPETFYEVEVTQANVVLNAVLSNTGGTGASMYLLDGCTSDASSCVFGGESTTELEVFIPQAGTYYLVVDSPSSRSWSYDLDVSLVSGAVCQPGGTTCRPDGSLDVCSEDGLSIEYTASCAIACSGQSCGVPTSANDTCAGAFTISGSTRLVDDYGRFSDDINPQGACGITNAPGPDAVYALNLAANQNVQATVTALNSSDDPAVYIVANCSFASATCYAGQESSTPSASVGYYSALGETVYLVVDSDSASDTDAFVLDVEVNTAECSTGATRCNADGDAEVCTISRSWQTQECYFGCTSGVCDGPPNDTCATATPVPNDGSTYTFTGPMDAYANDYDIDGASCMSSSFDDSPGPDAVYSVTAQANDIFDITWTPPDEASLYIVTDCADLANTCVAGDETFSTPISLQYIAPADGVYYIVADVDATSSTNISDLFEMEIKVSAPNCIFGQTQPSCLPDGQTLEYCQPNNTLAEFNCVGSCAGGACANPTGDTCFDAKDATSGARQPGGVTYTFDTTQLSEAHDSSGTQCTVTTTYTSGLDAFAKVDLQAGETLTATVKPGNAPSIVYADPGLLIVSDCLQGASSCLAGDSGQDTDVSATYTATSAETVYIIADSDENAPTSNAETFDLVIEVN